MTGIFLGLKLVIPVMAKAGRDSIINSSSVAGLTGSPGLCAYVANKHAFLGLTRAAAVEWGAKAIRVNCINPGPIESRMMASIEEGARPGAAAAVQEGFAATIPMKRYRTPAEVAVSRLGRRKLRHGYGLYGRWRNDGVLITSARARRGQDSSCQNRPAPQGRPDREWSPFPAER